MSESDRPHDEKTPVADPAPRVESAQPMAGRSGTAAEIGRELGVLDFEPEELLASLRPFEPDVTTSAAPTPIEDQPGLPNAVGGTSGLNAPRLPQWDDEEWPSVGTTPNSAAPSEAVPSEAVPSEAVPSEAVPSEAVPSEAVPSDPPSVDSPPKAVADEPSASEPFPGAEPSTHALPKPERDVTRHPRHTQNHAQTENVSRGVPTPSLKGSPATGQRAPTAPAPQRLSLPKRPLAPPRPTDLVSNTSNQHDDDAQLLPAASSDPNAPDVVASEDAAILEELIALPPERSQALTFELERSASDHLRERDLMDAYHGLAVILTREAQAPRHPQEQAELALVNSELLAMLGELETAREYLHALTPTSTPPTALQARQLAFAVRDLPAYGQLLKAEIRSHISHESRRHLMALYADVTRLLAQDEAEGRRHLELSLRAFPSDPRFWLQRLSDQLGDGGAPSRLRAPSVPDSPKLSDALRDLMALRGGPAKLSDCSHAAGPLMAARHAWQIHDFGLLLDAVAQMRSVEELAPAAAWLYACLTAYSPAFRSAGTAFIEHLLEQGDAEAELALLERRLHTKATTPSSVEALSIASVPKLSPADRLSLALAVDAAQETLRVLADAVASPGPTLALARAVQSQYDSTNAPSERDDSSQIRLALGAAIGRLTATPPSAESSDEPRLSDAQPSGPRHAADTARIRLPRSITQALARLAATDPNDEIPKALRLLDTALGGDPADLATVVSALAAEVGDAERGTVLALAALLAQIAGATDVQKKTLELAIAEDGRLETAYRGLLSCSESSTASETLSDLVARLEPSTRRVFLDLEAQVANGVEVEPLLNSLQECLASSPHIAPFIQCLATASSLPSTRGWSLLSVQSKSPAVGLFVTLLDALQTGPRQSNVEPQMSDTGLAQDDPLAHTLLATLGHATVPLPLEGLMLDGQLLDWLLAGATSAQVPTRLDTVDLVRLSTLAARQKSPILAHWVDLCHSARSGDASAFAKNLERATVAPTDAEFIDTVLESVYLDEHREPTLGSIECVRRILERDPKHLAALRLNLRYEAIHRDLHQAGQTATRIAQLLDGPESHAHAWLGAVSTIYDSEVVTDLELSNCLDTLAANAKVPTIWACRKQLAIAQARKDDHQVLYAANYLRQICGRALDAATLTLRAAEAASRLEQWENVDQLLERAVDLYPEHLVALSMRAEFLEARGELLQAAKAFDALAEAACMPAHKVAAWVQAATLWSDATPATGPDSGSADDTSSRVTKALERAVELDPAHTEATARLRNQYLAQGDLDKLEQLLTRMLLRVDDSAERAQIEYDRARALLDLGRTDEAQSGLERALSLIPSHEPALVLAACLHEQRGDFEGAEQQLLRLASLCTDTVRQLDAYRRLAVLYETYLEQPARAEMAYREVLQREPNDPSAEQLVKLLLRQDNPLAAVELLQQLVEQAADPVVERARNLELARIFDEILSDRRRAEEVLDRTRRRWPNDAATLEALAAFYRRGKDTVAFNTLLERSVIDARRALGQGRFDATYFEVVACVADLRQEVDLGRVARATVAAVNADRCELDGIGPSAAAQEFSDALAPDVLSLPIRAMLRKTGWALCSAHPIDVRALRASPLAQTEPELSERIRTLARSFGLFELDLHLSPALGAVCQSVSSVPPTLVVGAAFVALPDAAVRDALANRALRILSANASALANTAPVDLWPLLIAYLSAYLPDWLPPAIDPNKIAPIRKRISAVLPTDTDADLPILAADVAASIGNRASQLGIAVQQWGSRTALLNLGNPEVVLTAIAASSGQTERLSNSPVERQKWIVRNPEARDLMIFSISDAYIEARAKALAVK